MGNIADLYGGIEIWDVVLIAVVTITGTIVAYVHQPKWKSFFLLSPIPFTFATLALGEPVNATHVTGLAVLLGYTYSVKLLHYNLRVPIFGAISLSALGYCAAGSAITMVMPTTEVAFWIASTVVYSIALTLHFVLPYRSDEGQRSPLPVWAKFIAITGVILFIIMIKSALQGFMTVFPMVGVVVAYEARRSLHTVCRHIPVAMLTLTPMMVACRILQNRIGLGPALLAGWAVFLIVMPLFVLPMWRKYNALKAESLAERSEGLL